MKHRLICNTDWLFILYLAAILFCNNKVEAEEKASLPKCRLAVLDDEEAWKRMTRLKHVAVRRLPTWARALAGPLPRTTASMLELDNLYRTSDAIEPRLRAKMRWVAARANRCAYSQRYAEADLLAAGMSREEVGRLESSLETQAGKEGEAIRFARKLTLEADMITDEEITALISAFGEEQVVAMVLQMAYANFQDRLLLTLNVDVEHDGPLRPLAIRFAAPDVESIAADRPSPKEEKRAAPDIDLGSDWTALTFEQLIRSMEQQRARPARIKVPEWKDVYSRLPPGTASVDKPMRIKWSLVVIGYQPKMGQAWFKCMHTFGLEAHQDRVFEETLFWVITRTNRCFY